MRAALVFFGLAIAVAGCTNPNGTTNNTETGGLVGTGLGAGLGAVIGNAFGHNATSTVLGAAAGGLAGYFAGTYIGQQLDERDREMADAETSKVLDDPAPTPSPGQTVYIHHPRPRKWHSDHTTASGSSTLEKVSVTPEGNECRSVRQLAVINGQEIVQHTNYCETASGAWKVEAA